MRDARAATGDIAPNPRLILGGPIRRDTRLAGRSRGRDVLDCRRGENPDPGALVPDPPQPRLARQGESVGRRLVGTGTPGHGAVGVAADGPRGPFGFAPTDSGERLLQVGDGVGAD